MPTEVQQFFGSDATVGGIRFQFATNIKDNVQLLKQAREDGKDCKDVVLSGGAKEKGQMTLFCVLFPALCFGHFIFLQLRDWDTY